MSRLTRDDIIIAAGRRFAEYGYHGTSMRDLGGDLGILGSSIYAHVGGKHDLLVAVVERAGSLFTASAQRARRDGADPADTLYRLIRGHIDVLVDHAPEARTFLNEATFLEPDDRKRVTAERDRYEATFRLTLEEGIAAGDFRELDVVLTGIYILSVLNAIGRWYDPDGPVDRDALAADLHSFALRGVAAH